MEIVAAVAKRKLASIDVIGMEEYPFQTVLGSEIGKGLQQVRLPAVFTLVVKSNIIVPIQYHESQGVKFHMKSKVEKIVPSETNPALAGGVVVNGQTLRADFVVMGVGVAPATEFLRGNAELELERDGGVKVDEFLRVKGLRNVYAIGDIAVHPQQDGESRRIEHWNVSLWCSGLYRKAEFVLPRRWLVTRDG
jgi:apoptosis-inducing factor 3